MGANQSQQHMAQHVLILEGRNTTVARKERRLRLNVDYVWYVSRANKFSSEEALYAEAKY